VIEEYEEVLVQEEFPEPPVTDTTPIQGKPWCITHIFYNHDIYCVFTLQEFYDTHIHIYMYLFMSLTSAGSRSYFA
jgi:hypothetical protein